MFPRNENRNKGTFAKTTLLETALYLPMTLFGVDKRVVSKRVVSADVPPERKPERGYVRQNHPFTKPPFYLPVTLITCLKHLNLGWAWIRTAIVSKKYFLGPMDFLPFLGGVEGPPREKVGGTTATHPCKHTCISRVQCTVASQGSSICSYPKEGQVSNPSFGRNSMPFTHTLTDRKQKNPSNCYHNLACLLRLEKGDMPGQGSW